MPYKPVGVDENSQFPPRVKTALANMFVTKPAGITDGQVAVWDADTSTWVAGMAGLPPAIDGGIWDPITNSWVHGSGEWPTPPPGPDPGTDIDGGTPSGN